MEWREVLHLMIAQPNPRESDAFNAGFRAGILPYMDS